MKKILFSILVAGATLISGTACAQNDTQSTGKVKTEQGMKAKKDKGDHKGDMKKGGRQVSDPFKGIELTADQQKQLQVLRQGIGPVMPQSYEKNDSIKKLTDDQKQKMRQERANKMMETKKSYLGGVKQILTPDQYIVFLENVYLYGNSDDLGNLQRGQNMKSQNGHKGFKKGEAKGEKKGEKKSERKK